MIKFLVLSALCLSFFGVYGQNKAKNENFVESLDRGIIVYEDFCMNCHLPDGKGVEKITPPLALSDFLLNKRKESIKIVKFGKSGEIVVNGKTYNGIMTAMGLSDKEIADVMNYITNSFGNTNDLKFTEEEVLKIEQ